jgi:hypothetical protein
VVAADAVKVSAEARNPAPIKSQKKPRKCHAAVKASVAACNCKYQVSSIKEQHVGLFSEKERLCSLRDRIPCGVNGTTPYG